VTAGDPAYGDGFDVRSLAMTFRDGYRTDVHTHPWAQLVYARSGVMNVAFDGLIWFVPPTRAIWIPPRMPHRIDAKGEVALRTLYIAPSRAGAILRSVEALEVPPLLSELIQHILTLQMLDPLIPGHARLAAVLVDLIAAAPRIDLALPLPRDERALRLAERLRDDPAERRDLELLAGEAGASLRTLQRCFADETGLTIDAWRQKARLVHAAALLAAGASVTSAALDCGYDSPSAFIAAFRRQFGVTPGKFAGG
jgi:AraC-like DNA-binding protein